MYGARAGSVAFAMADMTNDLVATGSLQTPDGPIRPGQVRPYRKASRAEIAERVNFVKSLVVLGFTRGQIHAAVEHRFGVAWRQCDAYIARAREELRDEANISLEDLRAEAIEFYRSLLRNHQLDISVRLLARKRLDDILGLEAAGVLAAARDKPGKVKGKGDGVEQALDVREFEALFSQYVGADVTGSFEEDGAEQNGEAQTDDESKDRNTERVEGADEAGA
jgi:hypothetical protein